MPVHFPTCTSTRIRINPHCSIASGLPESEQSLRREDCVVLHAGLSGARQNSRNAPADRYTRRVQGRQRTLRAPIPTHQGWIRANDHLEAEFGPRRRVHRRNKKTRPGLGAAGRRLAAEEGRCAAATEPSSEHLPERLRPTLSRSPAVAAAGAIPCCGGSLLRSVQRPSAIKSKPDASRSPSRQTAPKQSRRLRSTMAALAQRGQLKGSDGGSAKPSIAQYATPNFLSTPTSPWPRGACAHVDGGRLVQDQFTFPRTAGAVISKVNRSSAPATVLTGEERPACTRDNETSFPPLFFYPGQAPAGRQNLAGLQRKMNSTCARRRHPSEL